MNETNSNSSINQTCCGYFIDTLNRLSSSKNQIKFKCLFLSNDSDTSSEQIEQEFVINNDLTHTDIDSFLNYCNIWQQKQCVCIFTKDDLIEKFHHFLHNIISLSIIIIKNLPNDIKSFEPKTNDPEASIEARKWSLDTKEKLFVSLIKIFSLNMPLYLTYKHLLFNNHGRYTRLNECSCSTLNQDSLNLIQIYCTNSQNASPSNKELENLPIEYLRNICHFIDLNGLISIKQCFKNTLPDTLPLSLVHLLFNIIVNIRVWLNTSVVELQVLSIRPLVINYMCQLCDKDLRLAGTRNTTELMYESFKLPGLNSYINETSQSQDSLSFRIDRDGLSLAYKYLTSSTLTIRLCGVAQMNLQINAWSEFNSLYTSSLHKKLDQNELAEWFIENNIVEYLYGPNLHVEVIKRSQDIVNFLAFTNRLTEKHLDAIWASAQLKHCSKPVMETLISLIKHLNVDSIKYLSKLIARLDLNKQNELTLLLSALLTKNLWSLMLDFNEDSNRKSLNSTQSSDNSGKKKTRCKISSSEEEDDEVEELSNNEIKSQKLRQRRQTVNTNFVNTNNLDDEDETDEDYEESDEDDDEEEETDEDEEEEEEEEVEPKYLTRTKKKEIDYEYDLNSQDGLEEELIKINEIIQPNKYEHDLNSHSSNISNASSVKNLKDLDDELDDEELINDEETDREINGDDLLNNSRDSNFLLNRTPSQLDDIQKNEEIDVNGTKKLNLTDLCEPGNTFLWDLLVNPTLFVEDPSTIDVKVLKEAEKQFQTLICLPTTDRRIKFKFIESCIKNIERYEACPVVLRLMPKIFSSFQQYTTNTFNFSAEFLNTKKLQPEKPITEIQKILFTSTNTQHNPSSEIHKIVSLTNLKFNLIDEFFSSLKNLRQDQRGQIQTRLQFLSFIYSSIGSPREFELTTENVEILWTCLIESELEVKDDLFNWFLNQAKSKDQHAISIENFKLIFLEKIPLLDPNNFSQSALHLYQELFKIYKLTTQETNEHEFKQMEDSAVSYILKLAFKSKSNDVSLSAIQFLNANNTENEVKFLESCLDYLNTNRDNLMQSIDLETNLIEVQRGLLLVKNHLDLYQRKNSYRLRLLQIKETKYMNHCKNLIDFENDSLEGFLRLVCNVNSTRFKFDLVISQTDCVGDLRAVVREILLNVIKVGKEINGKNENENSDEDDDDDVEDKCNKFVFTSNNLNNVDLCKRAYLSLIQVQGNQNADIFTLIRALIENEDGLYIKLYANSQELATTQIIESKLLSEIGLKDQQTIHVSLFSKVNQSNQLISTRLDPNTIPMIILSKEHNFNSLFKILNLLAEMSSFCDLDPALKKKTGMLCHKLWKIIITLPSNQSSLTSIKESQEWHLSQLLDFLLNTTPIKTDQFELFKTITFDRPFQLLYYIQLIEIVFKQTDLKLHLWSKYIYKLTLSITNYLIDDPNLNTLKFDVLLECASILFKLLNKCLFEQVRVKPSDDGETPKKKFKKNNVLYEKLNYTVQPIRFDLFNSLVFNDELMGVFINFMINIQYLSSLTSTDSSLRILENSMRLLVDSQTLTGLGDKIKQGLSHKSLNETRLNWFKSLILSNKSVFFRREASTWFYRLCLIDESLINVFLNELLQLVHLTLKYTPTEDHINCKEYFLLITTLLSNETKGINFKKLLNFISNELESRDIHETINVNSPSYIEDDLIIGLLNLACTILKYKLVDDKLDENLCTKLIDYLFMTRDDLYPRVVLPKFRSTQSRQLGFDLLVELCKFDHTNFDHVFKKLMNLHEVNTMCVWDYWPREDVRSIYGYLGLVNLGATCYMATSLQHLFMIKQARKLILNSVLNETGVHDKILIELKKIFAFLQESERKSYNPKELCKVYTMDNQVLNTGEQKDMQEFFTDLISKLEETSDPSLKSEIKNLFGGVITNMVISLDCSHVSSSQEEFYTVRCQVAGMKDLYESLNEITIKDTLEGDNMYTCSKCSKKVRAEKRACFRQLPNVLCFNTMRYTFNMVTMLKEKVNTHFSFPLQLNMSGYMEHNLIESNNGHQESMDEFLYDLIGVTVHTGTADGGHYYSFIQESDQQAEKPKWFLFNDAEVKQFDVETQLASECFGGEATSKTYDSQNDKFMDLPYEKTNSAYMLFYKRRSTRDQKQDPVKCNDESLLSQIWSDNLKFITDRLIFESSYFNFVDQLAELTLKSSELTQMGSRLAITFFLETFIHAREKHNMIQWIDLLSRLFSNRDTAQWFLTHVTENPAWLSKILIKCPQNSIRISFQKFLLNITQQCLDSRELITLFLKRYLSLLSEKNPIRYMQEYFGYLIEFARLGETQNLTLLDLDLCKKLVSFYVKNRKKNLNKTPQSDEEYSDFSIDNLDSDSDFDDDIIALNDQKSKLKVFEKLLTLQVTIIENYIKYLHKNSNPHKAHLKIPLSFYYKTILDGLNLNLIKQVFINMLFMNINFTENFNTSLYVEKFMNMCVKSIELLNKRNSDSERHMNFFNALGVLLSYKLDRVCPDEIECVLCETEESTIDFSELVIQRLKPLLDSTPYFTLQWLIGLGNDKIETWLLDNMSEWVKKLLIDAKQTQIRFSAAILLVNLVPDRDFRQEFTSNRNMLNPFKIEEDQTFVSENLIKIIKHLFSLMSSLEINENLSQEQETFQTTNLIQYFTLLIYFMINRDVKKLFTQHENTLEVFWEKIFYPHIANNHVTTNLNKQVMVHFMYHCLNQCDENLEYITSHTETDKIEFKSRIARELPLCTVVVDHEDGELISYNRQCLHPYYASLRLLCEHSTVYLKQMCQHSNFQWAFKHILPYSIQYPLACTELIKLVDLFTRESVQLKENLCTQFLMSPSIEPKQCWQSITSLIKTILRTPEDSTLVLTRRGLSTLSVCFFQVTFIYNNTQDNQVNDLNDVLDILKNLCENLKEHVDKKTDGLTQILGSWKEKFELIKRLVILLNFSTPLMTRNRVLEVIKSVLTVSPIEIYSNTVSILKQAYSNMNTNTQNCQLFQKGSILSPKPTVNPLTQCTMNNQNISQALNLMGPNFPVPKKLVLNTKKLKSSFNLFLPITFINHSHFDGSVFMCSQVHGGQLSDYERGLKDAFVPYFSLIEFVVKKMFEHYEDLNVQSVKNLVDLTLVVGSQAIFFDVSYLTYMSKYLLAQGPSNPGTSSSTESNLSSIVSESTYLNSFIKVILTDYRHVLNRKEFYEFIKMFMTRFIRSTTSGKVSQKSDNFSNLLSQTIKNIISLSLSTINEIRFYYEFQRVKLENLLSSSEVEGVNFNSNLENKSSNILGSIKCIYMIISSISDCKIDKQFIKFVKQLKNFYMTYTQYMQKQHDEMTKFLEKYEKKTSDDETGEESSGHKSKKLKVEETSCDEVLKQVKLKHESLNIVIQTLYESVSFMNTLMESCKMNDEDDDDDDEEEEEEEEETSDETSEDTSSGSSTSSSSQESSTETGSGSEQDKT